MAPDNFSQMVPQAHTAVSHAVTHVAPHVKHVAQTVAAHTPTIISKGYSMLSMVLDTVVSLGVGFGLGWYIKGRGVTGVKTDISNAQTTVTNAVAEVKAAV